MGLRKIFERRRIESLPKNVADRIAAGEVVDRPVSIVKELIENSLDSGADSITLEIKNGGKSYIRVTDNGCGIPAEDVEIAFLRHATSKIRTDDDLFSIETLGFRGEALASIASVSRTQMITKVPEESAGIRISIDGGLVSEKVPTGAADGTTIIVQDLFYNTPAREKFLKKDNTESSLIIDFISKMTLAYPDVRFKLINNEKQLFATSGKGSILENIYMVYGRETAANLISFKNEKEGISVEGFISNPLFTKSTRKQQLFFVNGRAVSNKVMEKALDKGYGDKIFEGRRPVAFIFLDVSPESVDVNVHPNKKEIRFRNAEEVGTFIQESIFECLNTKAGLGSVSEKTVIKSNILDKVPANASDMWKLPSEDKRKSKVSAKTEQGGSGAASSDGEEKLPQNPVESVIKERLKDKKPELNFEFKKVEAPAPKTAESKSKWGNVSVVKIKEESEAYRPEPQVKAQAFSDSADGESDNRSTPPVAAVQDDVKEAVKEAPEQIQIGSAKKFDMSELQIMGVLFNTYIAASDGGTFYLIDQHAAHERVFYEQFLKAFYSETTSPQMMMVPMIKEIPYEVVDDGELNWLTFLTRSGFIAEPFGGKSYVVKGIPSYMDMAQAERFLDDYIESISASTDFKDQKTLDRIIMRSCKSAVKANDVLSAEEIRALLRSLSQADNPFSCPHGRPVIIKLTKRDLEKMFKRVL